MKAAEKTGSEKLFARMAEKPVNQLIGKIHVNKHGD
jgi:hypothetical protein